MKAQFVSRLRKNGNNLYVSIPVEILEKMGLSEGDIVQMSLSNDFGEE